MHQLRPTEASPTSVIAHLRGLVPFRIHSYAEARLLAERLASTFLRLYDIDQAPVPVALVADLPKVRVEIDRGMPEPTSGASIWDERTGSWVITINGWEPKTRQRFTVLHEFFHILVHRHVERAGIFRRLTDRQVEAVADYFAGCVLVPKRALRRAWASGMQATEELAEHFYVSPRAMEVRLDQEHLTGDGPEFQLIDQVEAM